MASEPSKGSQRQTYRQQTPMAEHAREEQKSLAVSHASSAVGATGRCDGTSVTVTLQIVFDL
jgi:hypothetical protein